MYLTLISSGKYCANSSTNSERDKLALFVVGERCALSGSSADEQGVNSGLDLKLY